MGTLENQLKMGTGAVKADRPAKHKGRTSGALRKRRNSGHFPRRKRKRPLKSGLLAKRLFDRDRRPNAEAIEVRDQDIQPQRPSAGHRRGHRHPPLSLPDRLRRGARRFDADFGWIAADQIRLGEGCRRNHSRQQHAR